MRSKQFSYIWKLSLLSFILAGSTGFLFRLGMLGWIPPELNLANIRHAHSHLMFFAWAVPMPMYFLMTHIIAKSAEITSSTNWMKNSLLAGLIFGICSYPFFLLFGYKSVEIGSASLPFSVIFAGLVMISWYGFIYGYIRLRKTIQNQISTQWFDGALLMLVICSLGAWGVAVVQNMNGENYLFMKGLTHFFLATFTEGWLVLALISILIQKLNLPTKNSKVVNAALACILIGAPLTFPYGISESLLSPIHLATARGGGLLASLGTGMILYQLYTSTKWKNSIWIWPLMLLAAKVTMQAVASILPSTFWLSDHGLRIFYLHVLLLGAYTLAMMAWLTELTACPKKYYSVIVISVLFTLATLILPTGLIPQSWSGMWIIYVLMIFALIPVLAVAAFFGKVMSKK